MPAQGAITEGEIDESALPKSSIRNAFTAIMTPKSKRPSDASPSSSSKTSTSAFKSPNNLGAYIDHPKTSDGVIFHNPSFVAIRDLYPKSSVHTLLLPRSPEKNLQHPFDALSDIDFLSQVRVEAAKLKTIVAKELQRRYGPYSAQDSTREAVLSGEASLPEGEELPPGRDWETEVKVGIHARPSMNHLHIHVLSVDHYSDRLKSRNHYNSFTTPFFVPLEDFPIGEDDPRRYPHAHGYLSGEPKCWRCGEKIEKLSKLKVHLKEEFEEWKRE